MGALGAEGRRKLRYQRLLYDLWDYAYVVLLTAAEGDVYTAVSGIRGLWESAGTTAQA